ncbi:MAG: hypothetical protein EXS37_06040 [Opitutus sp.]|nr:hypothetical protein [Opitutus sp.]
MLSVRSNFVRAAGMSLAVALVAAAGRAADLSAAPVSDLIEQNRRLQEQVRNQQLTIETLSAKMNEVLKASERHERELRGLSDRVAEAGAAAVAPGRSANREREVRISAEAGLAFFNTGIEGQFPKSEFRVDDAVIAIEAPVRKNVYFYTELKLLTREANTENFQLGELFVDFEDISAAWGSPGLLNLRVGRINVPFGEEYLVRGPVANPLISHALSDIWGVDEGLEIHGRIGPAQYVVAVQNGGVSRLRDFNADKAVTVRVGWDPAPWLHLSGSAMRTGELASAADSLSEVWFGTGFFRSIAPANRATAFWANLAQFDARARWKTGHVAASIGRARYDDSDPVADNSRRFRFGHVEAVQEISGGIFGAVRYSEIRVPRGYPLAGWGAMGAFFFRPTFTTGLQRTSVGLGYRMGAPLVLKFEYTWESGRTTTGARRDKEDFFGTELGVKF